MVSSNVSPTETQKEILCRLKTLLFDVDLLTASLVFVSFVMEFYAFSDQLLVDLARKNDAQTKKLLIEQTQAQELVLVTSSLARLEALQKTLNHEKSEFKDRVVDISKWKKQI
ncbi:unnamed protein product [Vicia faba]|uniref:Uncharacterized protein n=1 Tax=Vicia faba TaxID=3906 RepID=A0AAV0YD54_VICFA|nr:unnamed protein product [Vicia faba]